MLSNCFVFVNDFRNIINYTKIMMKWNAEHQEQWEYPLLISVKSSYVQCTVKFRYLWCI